MQGEGTRKGQGGYTAEAKVLQRADANGKGIGESREKVQGREARSVLLSSLQFVFESSDVVRIWKVIHHNHIGICLCLFACG